MNIPWAIKYQYFSYYFFIEREKTRRIFIKNFSWNDIEKQQLVSLKLQKSGNTIPNLQKPFKEYLNKSEYYVVLFD